MPPPRLLVIMGSGETAPTMVSVHAELLRHAGSGPAVMLDTPFGFQENAEELVAKAKAYFAENVGHPIEIATFRHAGTATELERETLLARVAGAAYVFAGPGSPSYAVEQWRGTPLVDALREKLRNGGVITFASAAAVTLGELALPVYEVYKVGIAPHWLAGIDLLRETGIRAAVIPHFNNAEGGTHDTRFCYMGERRLGMLEAMLPDECGVLGVDEHTACIIDLDRAHISVRGRGGITWRHQGRQHRVDAGAEISIADLTRIEAASVGDGAAPAAAGEASESPGSANPFMDAVAEQTAQIDDAITVRDSEAAVAALLALESLIEQWSRDSLASDERDRARAALRRCMVRVGDLAREGCVDPRDRVRPLVETVLELRAQARAAGRYDESDRLRDALVAAGIEIRDTRDGVEWEVAVTA